MERITAENQRKIGFRRSQSVVTEMPYGAHMILLYTRAPEQMTLWLMSEHDRRMDVVDEIRIQWGFDDKLIRSGSVGTFPLHVLLPPDRSRI